MDTYHTGLLIRALMLLGMIFPLVIAGKLLARHEKHRGSNLDGDVLTIPNRRRAAMQDSLRYTIVRERLEANDSEASAPGAQRRAA